ncbi:hypothetical protein BD410DRAFT_892912 [Rickenella mellea]|uniref:Uncharacterized protein n=1 Tax=Rickenella mellea TaxID=50990 RepID=A0A4R5XF16_9AGAM|nr:hypothetical protein BD410DRAFT_892912 [Rickenella mellea]
MIPLLPTLALALLSFVSSAAIILRIVIPILPPHPLSRRVAPKEFGLPNFRPLSPADKSHIWLAIFDLLALVFFVWQAAVEFFNNSSDLDVASDSASAVRLWLAVTIRQTCLLFIAVITLFHVRMGRPVSFSSKHWMLWVPTFIVVVTSTTVAGIFSHIGMASLYIGIVAYSSTVAIISSAAFVFLVATLVVIRRNLAAVHEPKGSWPPAREDEKQPRPSFATEDIDALKDGSSWITSNASTRSHRHSLSAFSFSTTHTAHTQASARHQPNPVTGSYPSIPAKSSFWFSPITPHGRTPSPVPPVPPLPSPYRPSSPTSGSVADDPDPFRRSVPPAARMGSQSSWLTENSASQVTLSAWSYPTTRPGSPPNGDIHTDLLPTTTAVSRPNTPGLSSAQVLGGYGYAPTPTTLGGVEKGLAAFSAPPVKDIDVSGYRIVGWLILIWLPLAFSLPYFFMVTPGVPFTNTPAEIFLILSVTLSSPLLAANLLLNSPLPIPSGLFDGRPDVPSTVTRVPSPASTLDYMSRYKRSGSVTVVEGRRSGDVWIANGDAIDGQNKVGRAFGMLAPVPKLSVLPLDGPQDQGEVTPPLPMQFETPTETTVSTPQSLNSAELGQTRQESRASSYWSLADDSVAHTTRIMIAQRHYSAVAKTMVLPPSPEKRESYAGMTTSTPARPNSHIRSRSTSSINNSLNKSTVSGPRSPITPPPSTPLPPTPPRKPSHQRSNSSGFSFGAVNDIDAIDKLSAGILPLLVPGLTVGSDVKVSDTRVGKPKVDGFSSTSSFSSPENHSTPARPRTKKSSSQKRNHFSLPSLGLGRDGISSLRDEITRALSAKVSEVTEDGRRKTSWAGESMPNTLSHLKPVAEEEETVRPKSPAPHLEPPARKFVAESPPHTRADVPSGFDTARSSMATLIAALESVPMSAASATTRFSTASSDGGPEAESTPHNMRQADAPIAQAITNDKPAPYTRRSSIVYIKSDENNPYPSRRDSNNKPSNVRPLAPKPKASKMDGAGNVNPITGSPGLRPLSLLRDKDINRTELRTGGIRPLALAKKSRQNENANVGNGAGKLARSATSKARGVLRKEEVLPDVVVRPPSESQHAGYAIRFRP